MKQGCPERGRLLVKEADLAGATKGPSLRRGGQRVTDVRGLLGEKACGQALMLVRSDCRRRGR